MRRRHVNSLPNTADPGGAAENAFADLPDFDVIDGELLPRKPRRDRSAASGVDPFAERPAAS